MIAIVLAIALMSEGIGDFFTLPSWLTRAAAGGISSHDTPGSDPEDGTGWYSLEYGSEVVLGDWDVYLDTENGTPSRHAGQALLSNFPITYFSVGCWNTCEASLAIFDRVRSAWGREILISYTTDMTTGSTNANYLAWTFEYKYRYGGFIVTSRFTMHAQRVRQYVPVATGRAIPRAARLTPELQAGVNSTFEAYCERTYFAAQGQSNVWDVAEFGPRSNRKKFWFFEDDAEFCYKTNNRTITTRRLDEFDEIRRLYYTLSYDYLKGMPIAAVRRPGWIETFDSEHDEEYIRTWWSTTKRNIFTSDKIVPTLNWTTNPTDRWNLYGNTVGRWANCCQCFGLLKTDGKVWKNQNDRAHIDDERNRMNRPNQVMMYNLSFGQPNYNHHTCGPRTVLHTMREMIETNFPHADGWAISNETRRLVSDRLCGLNQLLGLMDRTYHEPEIAYSTVGTNLFYQNIVSCVGYANFTNGINGGEIYLNPSDIEWQEVTTTNRISALSETSDAEAMHWAVSRTATSVDAEVITTELKPVYTITEDRVREFVDEAAGGFDYDNFVVELLQYSTIPIIDGWVSFPFLVFIEGHPSIPEYIGVRYIHEDITGTGVGVMMRYERCYRYMRSEPCYLSGPTQPGRDAGDRVVDCTYGAVCGLHRKHGIEATSLQSMTWNNSTSIGEYDSTEGKYYSRESLGEKLSAEVNKLYTRFSTQYGYTPTAWNSIIPINMSDVQRCRESVGGRLAIVYRTIGSTNASDRIIITGNRGGVTDVRIGPNPISIPFDYVFVGLGSGTTLTNRAPNAVEIESAQGDGKIGIMTRTDWKWHTLQMESEN